MSRRNQPQIERVDRMSTNVYATNDNKSLHSSLNSEFILYQVLLERIAKGDNLLSLDKESLLEYFQPNNEDDKKTFQEFDKEYKPDKAINWYTRETCIYKTLNKALRTQHIDDIVPFSGFIRDLSKQLSDEHKKFIQKQKSQTIQVYRGQFISKDEVNRLKSTKGQLISMNSFLSTSTNRKKALEFATSKPPPNDQLTSILLEISVNILYLTKPYADIRELSVFPEEEEILFMLGCVFRLNQVRYDSNMKLWIADFTLCPENDPNIQQFKLNVKNQLQGQNEVIAIGNFLVQMQCYELAEKRFEKMLNTESIKNELELAFCCFGLSEANSKQGHYEKAIVNLNKAIKYLTNSSSYNQHSLLVDCYNELGSIYTQLENYIEALGFYDKSLGIKTNKLNKTYFGLGVLYSEMKNYQLSLEYLQKSIQHFSENDHAFIAEVLLFMAQVYSKTDQINMALQVCDKALQHQLKDLPRDHPDISYTYSQLGILYSDLGNEDKAIDYFQKAEQIQADYLPSSHPDFGQTYKNFGHLEMKRKNFDKALEYYEKVLDNQLKSLKPNHQFVCETYRLIGDVYWEKNDQNKAIEYFNKIVESESERKDSGEIKFSLAYTTLRGDIEIKYHPTFSHNYSDELVRLYSNIVQLEIKNKSAQDVKLAIFFRSLARIYKYRRQFNESLINYYRLLDCYFLQRSTNQAIIQDIYKEVLEVHQKKQKRGESFAYYSDRKNQLKDDHHLNIENLHFERRHLDLSAFYFKVNSRQQVYTKQSADSKPKDISSQRENTNPALNDLMERLSTERKQKSRKDPSLASLYQTIAKTHYDKDDYGESWVYFNRSINCQNIMKTDDKILDENFEYISNILLAKYLHDLNSNSLYKIIRKKSKIEHVDHSKYFSDNFKMKSKYLDRAFVYFTKLIETNQKDQAKCYQILGFIQINRNLFSSAIFFFDKLLQMESLPKLASFHSCLSLGEIHQNLKQYDQAYYYYNRSIFIYQQAHQLDESFKQKIERKLSQTFPFSR